MIIVVIIFSLIYVILLALILVAYYRDNRELEKRILEVEKRETENSKRYSNFEKWCTDELTILQYKVNDLDIRERTFIFTNGKEENNTQKECDCNMPCGRKKGRGGRRK